MLDCFKSHDGEREWKEEKKRRRESELVMNTGSGKVQRGLFIPESAAL